MGPAQDSFLVVGYKENKTTLMGVNSSSRENLVLVVLALASIEVYRRLKIQAARSRKSSGEER